ncbi:aspartyl/asparaginyl beta-hydroxylase domain-containing protein [Serratia sp. B1]|nr:aspartyl/asparaginyl beta-hydroxylase domain-containing protein [Serratia sp. B1]
MMSAIYDWSVLALRNVYDRRIQGQPVLDSAALFPDAERFTAQWRQIREEALTVAHDLHNIPRFHEIMSQQASISANDARDWRMFIMKAYGQPIPRNLARCPTLAALIASSPDVLSASLSFLAPGKQVPPHRGPFRGILRGYLVLDMPKRADGAPAAVLKVDGREYRLHEGSSCCGTIPSSTRYGTTARRCAPCCCWIFAAATCPAGCGCSPAPSSRWCG